MNKQAILVIEDDEKIARLLEIELEFEGYSVSKFTNGHQAFDAYRNGRWELILLDVMLPGQSGIELLRRIRLNDQKTPVILLTAKDSVEDKVTGLDFGANDSISI